jgi:hypothetical protein
MVSVELINVLDFLFWFTGIFFFNVIVRVIIAFISFVIITQRLLDYDLAVRRLFCFATSTPTVFDDVRVQRTIWEQIRIRQLTVSCSNLNREGPRW